MAAAIPESALSDAVGPQGLPKTYAVVLGALSLILIVRSPATTPTQSRSASPVPVPVVPVPIPLPRRRHAADRDRLSRGRAVARLRPRAGRPDRRDDVLPGRRAERRASRSSRCRARCSSGCCSWRCSASRIRRASGRRCSRRVQRVLASIVPAACAGVAWGILGGALPGISPSITMALLLPLTYTLDPTVAIVMLASTYVGAEYGGSIPAILIRTPGTNAAAATVIDGYAMKLQGQGRRGARHLALFRVRRRSLRSRRAGAARRAAVDRGARLHAAGVLRARRARA